jgi:natural product precursor
MKRTIKPQTPTATESPPQPPTVDDLLSKLRELDEKELERVNGGDICAGPCQHCTSRCGIVGDNGCY